MNEEAEHRRSNPGTFSTEESAESLTRGEYQKNQVHFDEMQHLRRAQDLKLLEVLEVTCGKMSVRFQAVEDVVREMRSDFRAERVLFEEVKTRQEGHEGRIRELEKTVASLKAWILIVGGITGIASFLAIALK